MGDGHISDQSSVKLPSDSYESNLPEHAIVHSVSRPLVEEQKEPPKVPSINKKSLTRTKAKGRLVNKIETERSDSKLSKLSLYSSITEAEKAES